MNNTDFNFPLITHINDVLPHIENYPEFIVTQGSFYSVVKYVVSNDVIFKGDDLGAKIRRECRGITFDKDGFILSRPYHKFFNLNEKEWTQDTVIDFNKSHAVLDKLDGSMVHPLYISEGKFRLATKAGITDTSMNAENFLIGKQNYNNFINYCLEQYMTPIFEWVSRENRIVLDYPDNLILTAIRYNQTGEYVSYHGMIEYAKPNDILVVDRFDDINDVYKFVEANKDKENLEGFVVRFHDGDMIKIKLPWYVLRHKSKEIVTREVDIVRSYLDETIDDLKSYVIDEDRKKIDEVVDRLEQYINYIEMYYMYLHNTVIYNNMSRKEIGMSDQWKNLPFGARGAIFSLMDGKNVRELVLKHLTSHTRTIKMWDEFKEKIGSKLNQEI